MSAELTIQVEGKPAETIKLGSTFSIGRDPNNDLVLDDSRASRDHADIRRQGDSGYYLIDLGSVNGTFLNGRRVAVPSQLKSGDRIQVVNCQLGFVQAEPEKSEEEGGEELMATRAEFALETISIIVVDIRNYTGLSEEVPAQELSRLIGCWFRDMVRVIEKCDGSIDKFTGDGLMAIWKRAHTEGDRSYVVGPLRAAREMLGLAGAYDKQIRARYPKFGFNIGVGINTGKAIMGNVGMGVSRDFTTVGDSVNVAFRLESLCKELKRNIIVSGDVKEVAGNDFEFEDMGLQSVKGKKQQIQVYALRV